MSLPGIATRTVSMGVAASAITTENEMKKKQIGGR
jgi:hypothetical protein